MSDFDLKSYNQSKKPAQDDFDLKSYNLNRGQPQEKSGAGMAALEQAGQMLTLGNLPQLQGAASRLVPNPNKALDEKMRSEGFTIDQPEDSYTAVRDETAKRLEQQQKDFPTASKLGQLAGFGLSIPLTGAAGKAAGLIGKVAPVAENASKGAKIAAAFGRIGEGAKLGAATGFLQSPGVKEGEADMVTDVGDRLKQGVKGAAIGGAVQGGLEALGPIAAWASSKLGDRAAKNATKVLGGTKKEIQNLQARDKEIELGRQLLDDGAIPIFATPKRVSGRISDLKEKAGKEIGDIVAQSGDSKVVDAAELAQRIAQSPKIASLASTPGAEGLALKADATLATLAKKGKMSLKEAQTMRQNIDELINFSKQSEDLKGIQGVLYEIRSGLRATMNDAAPALKAPSRQYSNLASGEKILEGKLARDAANRSIGLTDTISGGAGAAIGAGMGGPVGAAVGGAAGAAVNKFGRTFGASVAARSQDALAKTLSRTPALKAFSDQNPLLVPMVASRMSSPYKFERIEEDPVLSNPQILGIFEQNPELLKDISDPKLKKKIMDKISRGPAVMPKKTR